MAVTVNLCPTPKLQFNQNGVPLAGGKLFTYAAGTSTKLATYANAGGTTTNNNPIILDANGQGDCYLQGGLSYKLVLAPATDTDPPQNPYWTEDNITGINQVLSTFGTDVGVANAYAVNLNPALTSYANGQQVVFDAANSSTGASTLNVNGLGPKQILVNGQATIANSIQAGQRYIVSYSSTANAFLVLSSSSPSIQGSTATITGALNAGSITTSGAFNATGTSTISSVTAAASGSTSPPQMAQTIGAGATSYTDQTANRVLGTTYTNTTNRPIFILVTVHVNALAGQVYSSVLYVGGVNVLMSEVSNTLTSTISMYMPLSAIVPPGSTYQVTSQGDSIFNWYEY